MGYKQYCKEPEKIENYEKALADNFVGWDCHHRLETHTSDGERRLVDITVAELKALDMYYNRPASELIFLRKGEHSSFNKGKPKSEEHKKKIAEARKGKPKSEETKKKLSEAMKGKPKSEETKQKMREAHKRRLKGMRWYNNGKINIRAKECPDGFVPGRMKPGVQVSFLEGFLLI